MQIRLIAVGQKMPDWVTRGYQEYSKRLPSDYALTLIEVPAQKRGKNADFERLLAREGADIMAAIPTNHHIIALDRLGKSLSTLDLSQQLQQWHDLNQDISILVGGPEGLSPACLQRATSTWSLSALTLPHPLVRVILAEQLYRAWSILARHPYHR